MKEDNSNNFNAEFGIVLEESASALTKGNGHRAPEHHYIPQPQP